MTVDILRDQLTREAAAGFPLLRRTPCTGTVALIDYFEDQDAARRIWRYAGDVSGVDWVGGEFGVDSGY